MLSTHHSHHHYELSLPFRGMAALDVPDISLPPPATVHPRQSIGHSTLPRDETVAGGAQFDNIHRTGDDSQHNLCTSISIPSFHMIDIGPSGPAGPLLIAVSASMLLAAVPILARSHFETRKP